MVVALIIGEWSSDLLTVLLSAEVGLFFCMFTSFGAVFGVGFFVAYVRRSATLAVQPTADLPSIKWTQPTATE